MVGAGGTGHHNHGHGHHAHGPPYEVPDWRIYKVEDVAELRRNQQMLAQKGLKDPWARNEVWRYHPKMGTHFGNAILGLTRGWKWGLGLTVATILAEKAYHSMFPSDDHHHGHTEHH